MKANIFLIIIPKFKLQIHYTSEIITENVPISGKPILIFFLILIPKFKLQIHYSSEIITENVPILVNQYWFSHVFL